MIMRYDSLVLKTFLEIDRHAHIINLQKHSAKECEKKEGDQQDFSYMGKVEEHK